MTVKSSIDGEEDTTENMTERITATQQENWNHLRFVDEDSSDAWDAFRENLFVGDEVLEKQESLERALNLSSGFEDMALLDTISATRDAAKLSRNKALKSNKEREKYNEATANVDQNDLSPNTD
jgi:DNA-directed RNA polymerase-3 subunit RPC5